MDSKALERVLSCPTLPSLPGVAIKMLELMRQPGSSADRIADLIQNDPALATKVLRTVNSSYYGLSKPCPNITRAVALLGVNTVKSLTLGLSLVEMGRGAARGFDLVAYWRRAVYCSAAARLIAKLCRACDPDDAFVASLLQDVGMLASFAALGIEYAAVAGEAETDHDLLDPAELDALGFNHAEVGAKLAEKWRLPDQIIAATRFHHRPDAADEPNLRIVQVVAASGDVAAALAVADPQPKLVNFRRRMRQWFDVDGQTSDDLVRQTGAAAKELSKLLDLDTGAAPDINAILAEASEELLHHQVAMEREQSDLARQSVTDALTGAFNRKKFDCEVAHAFEHARASATPLAILFSDADRFKSVNDTLGHQAGDAVLIEIARRLRDIAADRGTVCRYGGEEFAIIVRNARPAEALELAEQFRGALERRPIDISHLNLSTREVRQTISIGVSCLEPGSSAYPSTEALVHAADEAVYAAKKAGRNRVCLARAATPEPQTRTPLPLPLTAPAPAAGPGGRRTVLIVEDDILSAKMLEILLSKHGNFRVVVAPSAEHAIRLLHGDRKTAPCLPDLALLDNNLPGMSGLDLLRACKAHPTLNSFPIVVMTTGPTQSERTEAQRIGASAYLDKADICSDFAASLRLITGFIRPGAAAAA